MRKLRTEKCKGIRSHPWECCTVLECGMITAVQSRKNTNERTAVKELDCKSCVTFSDTSIANELYRIFADDKLRQTEGRKLRAINSAIAPTPTVRSRPTVNKKMAQFDVSGHDTRINSVHVIFRNSQRATATYRSKSFSTLLNYKRSRLMRRNRRRHRTLRLRAQIFSRSPLTSNGSFPD
ncbi:hypothetical protein CLF_112039 [Clonorchis sinensis]|uniref:Uncharacterized protein n=1 Tax=Clonorchis sinensis TaxID=79923 RepID=G7YM82_CLOSI|nr:hypothetical protein CLF_112039 [Clonorchis sinensis]